ncbi:hypothetical protein [Pseudoflavonifractor phocaeensis]|uniref:hypothetical protein n=1 Tax=Pseudoflavonifractor phocaeensis TaxID=1870988 RepID=UPI00210A5AF0|nr:hypothetical protein [Pseudoflavonifractor phocaeensis]MCQ4864670.1 hypothetical protein [Pseudoflavonifractor phocaeensis]
MTDDALLPVYQGGETKSIEGALIKQYAKDSVRQYVDGAKQSADEAAVSAAAAKTAREGVEAYADQAGQSATQSAGSAATAQGAATAADAAKTAAAGSATAAQKSAADAQASKTAAGKSETNAAGSAAAADKSKVDAQAAQRAAESAKTAAESSAILAGGKAAEAGQKATEAGNSASAAAESAAAAAKSKTDAEAAKTAAQTAKTEAEAARTASETAKTTAQTAQGKAEAARDAAEVSAASAADSSTAAGASATAAAASAQTAIAKAGEASTSAGAAKTSETNAKKSETAAGLSADAAEQARQAIEALGVQGVTLAAGSQAAVEKVVASDGTVTLKFSIPQGAKGDKGSTGDRGVSISSIQRTAGNGAAGTTDTYTITLSDGSTSTFAVYNGRDGEGSGDMAASVYDPAGKSSQVATEAELEALPVKHLVGTDAAPVNLDDLLEPGIYYITGTQTTTVTGAANGGLLDNEVISHPLFVSYHNTYLVQCRASDIGDFRARRLLGSLWIKMPFSRFVMATPSYISADKLRITELAEPEEAADAATKRYVDETVSALPVKRLVGTEAAPIDIDTLTEPGRYYLSGEIISGADTGDVWAALVMFLTAGVPLDIVSVTVQGMSIREQCALFEFGGTVSYARRQMEPGSSSWTEFSQDGVSLSGHTHVADDVSFADGETFQAKLDAGKLNGADGKSAYQQAVDAGYTGTEAAFYAALVTLKDAPFLPKSGGTMTGNIRLESNELRFDDGEGSDDVRIYGAPTQGEAGLYLSKCGVEPCPIHNIAPPSSPTDGANKQYVDAETAKCLPKSGGTMTGPICFSEGGAALIWHLDCGVLAAVPEDQVDYASPDFANLGVATPVEWFHAADKKYVDSKMLVFTGKTVAVSKWSANTTYSAQGYGFRASVACAGVTASHRPDVAFGAADAVGGNFAPFSESYAGGVYIYCKTKPTATITIPSIVCIKGA